MRRGLMCLSVLAGLLFAGTLPVSANAAAGLTAIQVAKAPAGLVTKARWHGGWHGGWGRRGWGYGGWGYRRRWWGPGIYFGAWPYYGYGYYPRYYYGGYDYPYYYGYGGWYGGYGWRHRHWRHAYWGHRRYGHWGHRGWGHRGGWHRHR